MPVSQTVAITVDLSGARTPRPRDSRSGWHIPPKMTPKIILDGIRHPAWTLRLSPYRRPAEHGQLGALRRRRPSSDRCSPCSARRNAYSTQTWSDIERYRKNWKGNLVLKGILHREDARLAAEAGVDGILVSNHGGRQFERAPAPIEVLPGIVEAGRLAAHRDDGQRRISNGVDMLIAYALGAKFVFVGRATAWGVIAGGLAGAKRSIAILKGQIDLAMGQIGCTSPAELTKATLLRVPSPQGRPLTARRNRFPRQLRNIKPNRNVLFRVPRLSR